ncbi:peptidylprolyl isomerase [bacterium]|nr:peptidylprolyl isomerase [bacterium]
MRRLPLYTVQKPAPAATFTFPANLRSGPQEKAPQSRLAEVAKRLEAGQDFRQLVHEYSDSPSVENEGVLENLRRRTCWRNLRTRCGAWKWARFPRPSKWARITT